MLNVTRTDIHDFFVIGNDGAEIKETNYFHSDAAHKGMYYMTRNAGTSRLLCPNADQISEMATGKSVVLTRGKMEGQDSIEIMFDDGSDSPFAIFIPVDMCDMLPAPGKNAFPFTVWTEAGKVLTFTAHYRRANSGYLPCMQPWR